MLKKIVIKGAKEHNLKNVSLEIPKDKLVVITGLSGSGKSSLAFDTIYAEGQKFSPQASTGEKIKKYRLSMNLSQVEVASQMKKSPVWLSKIETDQREIKTSDLVKNLLPVPLSRENMPPMPGTQSIIRLVFLHLSCWSRPM